jgi:hypothetical protein
VKLFKIILIKGENRWDYMKSMAGELNVSMENWLDDDGDGGGGDDDDDDDDDR